MTLAIGDVIAIETLARSDQNLVIPATAAARAAYEVAVTCAWMLAPDDMVERDLRWEALFYEEREFWIRVLTDMKKYGSVPGAVETIQAEVTRVDAIINEIVLQLEANGSTALRRLPTFDERLRQLGQAQHYAAYKAACQLVHPTTRALRQVRDLEASHAEGSPPATYRYRTRQMDWTVALILGAESMRLGLDTLGTRLLPAKRLSAEVGQSFADVMEKVGLIPVSAPDSE